MTVAVVIPAYKKDLNRTEQLAFYQCLKLLSNYDIILAIPEGLQPDFIEEGLRIEEFDQKYFRNISGYNELLLSSDFYERFLNYDYILIHQLDAFVFRDDLVFWCEKNYDYIGAPWLATTGLAGKLSKSFSSKLKKRAPIFNKVGNGGFSLRKIQSFIKISKELKKTIDIQLTEKSEEIYAIEDVFWSLRVPTLYPEFKIPEYKEAANFALDRKPTIGLKLNQSKLPFGCHGFNKPKVIKFWEPIIEKEFEGRG